MKKTIEKILEILLYGLPLALIAGILDYRFHNYFWQDSNWFRLFTGGAMFDFASIFESYLGLFIIVYLFLIVFVKSRRPRIKWNWSFLAVILLGFGMVLAFSHYQGVEPVIKSFPAQIFTNYLGPIAIFLVLFDVLQDKRWRAGFERSLLISFGIFGAVIIFEYFSDALPGANRDYLNRLVWPYIDPFFDLKAESANWLAFLFGPIALLSMIKIKEKWPVAVGIIALAVVLASKSYTSIVILGVLIFWYLLWQTRKNWRKWVVLGTLLLGLLIVATQYNTPKFQILIGKYDHGKETSIERRSEIYQVTAELFKENWLVGLGPGNYQNVFRSKMSEVLETAIPEEEVPPHPHNLIMNLWSDLGIFGLLAMLFVYMMTGWKVLWRRLPYFILLAYPLGHGLLDTPYGMEEVSVLFWILMAMAASE